MTTLPQVVSKTIYCLPVPLTPNNGSSATDVPRTDRKDAPFVDQLQELFPQLSGSTLYATAQSSSTMGDAIDRILLLTNGDQKEGSLQLLHGTFPGPSKDEITTPPGFAGVERDLAEIFHDDSDSEKWLELSCPSVTNEQSIPHAACKKETCVDSPEHVMAESKSMTI
ncbi:uncharacterized protein LOC110063507 [Orbicella faveolata]|uniref:uncharacterized protein LOC110063507 n=1 Tax=Orbicella faveolata TaxID=48498 RepID=UPI0009E1AA11|nr:uncharacterized protein LOC110063507 [Orbicella faveolata]XP_020626161.1 uncharacterized protein LOC110063507 [Orbicella faveolata]